MKSVPQKETAKAVEALSEVLKKNKLKPKERAGLVKAVLRTVVTGKGPRETK